MYPSTSLFIAIGQLAIVILVMFSYPLQVHPCRNCLAKVFHPEHVDASPKSIGNGDDEEEELEPGGDEHGHHGELSPVKRFLLTTAIVVSNFGIAYFVSDLQMGMHMFHMRVIFGEDLVIPYLVLSFVGATGSTTISFILPGLLYWKVRCVPAMRIVLIGWMQLTLGDRNASRRLNFWAFCLMVYGICVCVFW